MLKSILFIATFCCCLSCCAQDEYIGLDKIYVKRKLGKVKRDNLKTLAKETDSTIVCAVRDPQIRDMVMVLYFDKNLICNKILEIFKIDSCYQTAFKAMLGKKHFRWTKILPGTYLSKYSRRLLLFENPNAPQSFILQHNRYMTKEQYTAFLPKGVE